MDPSATATVRHEPPERVTPFGRHAVDESDETDAAEPWGTSSDGKDVAIHVSGPDAPGVLSKGGGNPLHFVFVAAIP